MKVRLAVRPYVLVNGLVDTPTRNWIYTDPRWSRAMAWLGERYLCHKPVNRK